MKPCLPRNHAELIQAWDQLAEERHRQIVSGDDLSFHYVIAPTALSLLEDCNTDVVLDIGSGTGEFTVQLAQFCRQVLAVEPSRISTKLAKNSCRTYNNVQFFESPVEDIIDELIHTNVTCAVAVMSLMTAPQLHKVVCALNMILPPQAHIVAILTHPCFWPKYRGYDEAPWFSYEKEIFIEAPFAISRCSTSTITTHIHRPLDYYLSVFSQRGFLLDAMIEPMPAPEIEALYPTRWHFPRFIGIRWQRKPTTSSQGA